MGSSVAYHLRDVGCRGRIVVIERDHTYARASSNLAMGGIRQQFTLDTNIRMVQWSVGFYRDLEQRASRAGSPHRVSFQQRGYLFLADANCSARLTRRYEAMRSAGAPRNTSTAATCPRSICWPAPTSCARASMRGARLPR